MNRVIEQDTNQELSTKRTFPIQGTNLYRILCDPTFRQSFHRQLKQYNPLIAALYKIDLLPLFGVSRTVMLLTTRGRKSGKLRSIPIGYWRIGGKIYLFSAWGKSTSWYRNIEAYPKEVWVQIGLRRWAVRPQELDDPDEILRTIAQFIIESPKQAHYLFGWDPGRDQLDQADFSPVIHQVVVMRFDDSDN